MVCGRSVRGVGWVAVAALAAGCVGTRGGGSEPPTGAPAGTPPGAPDTGGTTSPCSCTTPPDLRRGVWGWADDGDPFGTTDAVGDASGEAALLTLLEQQEIGRFYGSYRGRPVTEPDAIAAWNLRLHGQGRVSDLLFGETVWVCDPDAVRPLVAEQFVAFNASRSEPLERFHGLHLDVEPQGLHGDRVECPVDWDATDDAGRLALMDGLAAVYEAARDEVGPDVPIAVDLPVWFDNVGTGSFHWPDDAARDAWFARVGAVVDSVSLMAFCREDVDRVAEGVAWEFGALDDVRIGLSAEHVVGAGGECETWVDAAHLLGVADDVEARWPETGVDFQSASRLAALVGGP